MEKFSLSLQNDINNFIGKHVHVFVMNAYCACGQLIRCYDSYLILMNKYKNEHIILNRTILSICEEQTELVDCKING